MSRISAADRAHRLEVALGGDREAGLDDVHAEFRELPGHPELLADGHAAAGRLLAVAQGGVEDQHALRPWLCLLAVPHYARRHSDLANLYCCA